MTPESGNSARGRARCCAKFCLARTALRRRHLVLDSVVEALQVDPDTLHARFAKHAPLLASQAGERALANAAVRPEKIDAVIVSTCTGYLCPGLTSYVAERLGLRPDVYGLDLVGQGCGAALPNLRAGESLIAASRAPKGSFRLRRSLQRCDLLRRRPGRARKRLPVRRRRRRCRSQRGAFALRPQHRVARHRVAPRPGLARPPPL